MTLFLLTSENIAFSKRELRIQFPQVKSSHLTEALAASMGYRTHAAVMAELSEWHTSRSKITRINIDDFSRRIEEFGYVTVDRTVLSNITRSADMPMPPWREHRKHDIAVINRWFRECQKCDIPNVHVEVRTKYAKLIWDCISIDPQSEAYLKGENGTILVRQMFKRFQSFGGSHPGKPEFYGSAFVGSIDSLLPVVAYELADDFFEMLYAPLEGWPMPEPIQVA